MDDIVGIFKKIDFFSSFKAGNCVGNSSFKWTNNTKNNPAAHMINIELVTQMTTNI